MKELIEDVQDILSEAHVCWGHACANVFEHTKMYDKATKINEKRLRAHLTEPKTGLMQNNSGHGHDHQMINEFSHERNMQIHAQGHGSENFGSLGKLHAHSPVEMSSFSKMGGQIQKHMSDEHGAGFLPNFNSAVAYHSSLHAGTAGRGVSGLTKGGITPKREVTNANRVLFRVKKYSRGR